MNSLLLDRLEKGLLKIQKELDEIKESQRRLETHNSFIVNLYLMVKEPIISFYKRFISIDGEQQHLRIDNIT